MSLILSREFYLEVAKGNVPKHSIIQKFGRNKAVPNGSIAPVSMGGNWRTPTALTTLRMRSTNAGDNATSVTGARKIIVQGIISGYVEGEEEVTLNGTTNVTLSTQFYRINRMYISESGVYANQGTASSLGEIILEDNGGANDEWTRIDTAQTNFGVGQSQIGCFSIQTGVTAYLLSKHITVDASKAASVYFFQRQDIDIVTAPFKALRLVEEQDGIIAPVNIRTITPLAVFPEKTDIGFMAVGDGASTSVSVDFELLIVNN